jgi:hypothetical protein
MAGTERTLTAAAAGRTDWWVDDAPDPIAAIITTAASRTHRRMAAGGISGRVARRLRDIVPGRRIPLRRRFAAPSQGTTVLMASALIISIWVGLNVVLTFALVGLGLLPFRTKRWTARDELRLDQWARAQTPSD